MELFLQRYVTYIFCGLLCALPASLSAATITQHIDDTHIGVGDLFAIVLTLDSEDVSINAIEGNLAFSDATLSLQEIRAGNSVVPFWIDAPQEKDGGIHFSGIIPGGYSGSSNTLFVLVFQARAEGKAEVFLRDGRALLNDGSGTPTSFTLTPKPLLIAQTGSGKQVAEDTVADTQPPGGFTPLLAHDASLYDGKYFLAFAAQDKESGVERYETAETRLPFPLFSQSAESPYLLTDQYLTSDVYIKAIDAAGNERTTVFHRSRLLRPNELIIGGILILLLLAYVFVRRRRT